MRRGFTLIELLVAITIISILVGGTTVFFSNAREKGRDTKRKQDLAAIKGAMALFYEDNHQYPPLNSSCTQNDFVSGTTQCSATDWIPDLVPTYIKKLPLDPKQEANVSGAPGYFFRVSSDRQTYTLWTRLENSRDPDINTSSSAACRDLAPSQGYDYCLKPD